MYLAYQIDYCDKKEIKPSGKVFSTILLTAMFFYGFLILVSLYWPEGREVLRLLLLPEDAQAVSEAAEVFASDLGSGEPLQSAVSGFFHRIADYASFR